MARGGKTAVLMELFKALKEVGMSPIYIDFSSNFRLQEGETEIQAILRLIASQLVEDLCESEKQSIVCDRAYLENYLSKSNRHIVLIIDELNSLAFPPEHETASFLNGCF